MRPFLESIAPFNKAKKVSKPMFVIAEKNDPRVPASESEQIVKIVRQNNTPVGWLEAKDEGHGFKKKRTATSSFTRP
jgi:dipeptidyl aminopeptidase/acylaminoacyl peptidase